MTCEHCWSEAQRRGKITPHLISLSDGMRVEIKFIGREPTSEDIQAAEDYLAFVKKFAKATNDEAAAERLAPVSSPSPEEAPPEAARGITVRGLRQIVDARLAAVSSPPRVEPET